jgi:hypothetical protein
MCYGFNYTSNELYISRKVARCKRFSFFPLYFALSLAFLSNVINNDSGGSENI